MKLSIRNIVIASAMMAAAVVTVESAKAETTVKVPFNFTVAGKVCPAGTYTVDKDVTARIVTLRSRNTPQTFRWILSPGKAPSADAKVTMSFDELGANHALKSVQYGSMTTSKIDSAPKHASDAGVAQGQ